MYNTHLANGLGNLVARVAKLCENNNFSTERLTNTELIFDPKVVAFLSEFKFNEALGYIWESLLSETDRKINQESPWALKGKALEVALHYYVHQIQSIAFNLRPFLPETSEKILSQFSGEIKSQPPLFPRIA